MYISKIKNCSFIWWLILKQNTVSNIPKTRFILKKKDLVRLEYNEMSLVNLCHNVNARQYKAIHKSFLSVDIKFNTISNFRGLWSEMLSAPSANAPLSECIANSKCFFKQLGLTFSERAYSRVSRALFALWESITFES